MARRLSLKICLAIVSCGSRRVGLLKSNLLAITGNDER